MQTHKDLIVWQRSIEFVIEIYRITGLFPQEEKFGLVSQMRRCSVSIPSNVAEGFGRKNKKENARFVGISYASALELETQIIISKKLNFINTDQWVLADKLLDEVLRMSYCYRESLYQTMN